MDALISLYNLVKGNMEEIITIVAYFVLAGSIIVKLTPTLKDDNYWKSVIKFIGKYIALDKYGPKGDTE